MPTARRPFQFFRAGGLQQVRFDAGADLAQLEALDQKLWVALACPTSGLSIDPRTLALIDSDSDGRIRAMELIAAVKWTTGLLKNPDELLNGPEALRLDVISDATDEGRQMFSAAKSALQRLSKPGASSISVAEASSALAAFNAEPFNGDGVVTAEAAKDEAARAALADVMTCMGETPDASGKPGVNQDKVSAFFGAIAAHVEWLSQSEKDAAVLPTGASTRTAWDALKAVQSKIDDYFTRCQLAAFDGRAIAALNREEKEYLALAAKDLTITSEEIRAFPLARIAPEGVLPLAQGLNPAWSAAMETFVAAVVAPLLGAQPTLTRPQWEELKRRFAPFEAWLGKKPGQAVEALGAQRIRALAQSDARARIETLLTQEAGQVPTRVALVSLEKLSRCTRDLVRLVNNFVSFRDFYERRRPAAFQVGTLYIDQRATELCIRVEDVAKHAAMAPLSRAYLLYCDCTRKATGQKMSIAAAITNGDSDNLMEGRNAVFYDRDGNDWDATVVKIVSNPLSIRQAFWSPYKKVLRFIEDQAAKRAAAADEASNKALVAGVGTLEKSAEAGKAEALAKKLDVGVVAALGVAVGGITAALGMLLQSVFGLGLWMPLGFVALLLAISGPSMAIAWLKLRQRNLGPLLDANGWAVNASARLNVPFGAALTALAVLPPGSRVDTTDPFAEKRRPWGLYLALAVAVSLAAAWFFGKLDGVLPDSARRTSVSKTQLAPPSPQAPPAAAAPSKVEPDVKKEGPSP